AAAVCSASPLTYPSARNASAVLRMLVLLRPPMAYTQVRFLKTPVQGAAAPASLWRAGSMEGSAAQVVVPGLCAATVLTTPVLLGPPIAYTQVRFKAPAQGAAAPVRPERAVGMGMGGGVAQVFVPGLYASAVLRSLVPKPPMA